MARRPHQELVRLPLLDALFEGEGADRDTPGSRMRRLKDSVRRDLQDLLNTRERCLGWPAELRELERSVLAYGVPDLTAANLASQERRNAFLQELAAIIRRQDPRFQRVHVQSLENTDPFDRTLRFRIEATLKVETGAETAVFDFHLEPISRRFE